MRPNTEERVNSEIPKSPWESFHTHTRYCVYKGLSNPNCALIFSTWAGVAHGPAINNAGSPGAELTRLGRSSMLEVLSQDYIRTARSKGLNEFVVVFKHAFRNALIPIITLLGLRIPWLFGGAVITETVFAWPGIGQLLVRSIYGRDFPVVEGIVLILAFLVTTTNLIVDISYLFIDPRIQYN
ncbi:hypothetical protein ES708_32157 [subsurface metagenome]